MSEYGLSFAISAPDGTRRYTGLMFKGVEFEGYVVYNPGPFQFPAGSAMTMVDRTKLTSSIDFGFNTAAVQLVGAGAFNDPNGLPLGRIPTWSTQFASPGNALFTQAGNKVLTGSTGSDVQIASATTIASLDNGFLDFYGIAPGMSLQPSTGIPPGNTVTVVTNNLVTVSPGGMTTSATARVVRFNFASGEFTVPNCVVATSSTITDTQGSRDFIARGVRPGMLVRGTGVPTGTVVISVTATTVTTAPTLTPTGGPLVMIFNPQGAPVADVARYSGQLAVQVVDNTVPMVGISLSDPVPGREILIGGSGTIGSVWSLPNSGVVGNVALVSTTTGRVTAGSSTGVAIGSGLGLILAPSGTDQTLGQSGVVDQYSVLVAPR